MNDPAPRAPRITRALAWTAPALLLAGPLATRTGLIPFRFGLLLCALAVVLGALVLLAALVMCLRAGLRPYRTALLMSATLAALPVAVGAAIVVPASGLPVIHDISTDLADPPAFVAALPRRGADANPLLRDEALNAAQSVGYPALGGILTPLAPAAALDRAAEVARALGWEVYAEDPASGTLEASETTFWFRFTDDVAVRVRPAGSGSRVDLRSVSRVGKGDLGANAKRIERFRKKFAQTPASPP